MESRVDSLRKMTSALLAGALLATSVLVPLLDRGASVSTPALETEHHASTCVVGHDHTICTQVGANLWIAPAEGSTVAHRPRLLAAASIAGLRPGSLRSHASTWSRAPPTG